MSDYKSYEEALQDLVMRIEPQLCLAEYQLGRLREGEEAIMTNLSVSSPGYEAVEKEVNRVVKEQRDKVKELKKEQDATRKWLSDWKAVNNPQVDTSSRY